MKKLFLILNLFIMTWSFSQKKVNYDCSFNYENKKGCNYILITNEPENTRLDYYNCLEQLIKTEHYQSRRKFEKSDLNGLQILYNYDGSIFSEGNYKAGEKDNLWVINYRDSTKKFKLYIDGNLTRETEIGPNGDTTYYVEYSPYSKYSYRSKSESYTNGKLTKIQRYSYMGKDSIVEFRDEKGIRFVDYKDSFKNDTAEKDSVAPPIDRLNIMPEFTGGQSKFSNYINDNLVYPKDAQYNEICGLIKLTFTIDVDGSIVDVKFVKDLPTQHPGLEKEALRLIVNSSGKWTPGKQDGVPVKVLCIIPIEFLVD